MTEYEMGLQRISGKAPYFTDEKTGARRLIVIPKTIQHAAVNLKLNVVV